MTFWELAHAAEISFFTSFKCSGSYFLPTSVVRPFETDSTFFQVPLVQGPPESFLVFRYRQSHLENSWNKSWKQFEIFTFVDITGSRRWRCFSQETGHHSFSFFFYSGHYTLSYFNIFEAFNLTAVMLSIAPSSLYSVSPFCIPPVAGRFRGKVHEKKEVEQLLEAKRSQGPRQLINVLLVSQQLKSTFLCAHRYSSVVFECCPARPVKYSNCFSYLLFQ